MYYRLSRPFFVSVACLATVSSGCKDPEYRVDDSAGGYQIAVHSPDGRDPGGLSRAEYKVRDGKSGVSREAAFTGTLGIPVLAFTLKENLPLDLSVLQIRDADGGAVLFTLTGALRSKWDPLVRKGVRIELTVTPAPGGGTPRAAAAIGVSPTPPPVAEPITRYVPITDRFPNPLELIESPDPAKVLSELRILASATADYENDLVEVVELTPGLRVADLAMLMDASYFTAASLREHQDMLALLKKERPTPDVSARIARVSANIELIHSLAPRTNRLAAAAVPKLTDISFSAGLEALKKLFDAETGGQAETDSAFRSFAARLASMQAGEKLVLVNVAVSKGAFAPAIELALRWFREDAGRSTDALVGVLGNFPPSPRADLAQAAFETMADGSLSASALSSIVEAITADRRAAVVLRGVAKVARLPSRDAVALLLKVGTNERPAIAEALLPKVTDLTPATAAALLETLPPDAAASLAARYVSGLNPLRAADLAIVAAVLDGGRRDSLILGQLPRIADPADRSAGALLAMLSPATREESVLRHVDSLRSLTTDALLSFADAASGRKVFVLTAYLDRVSDFTPANSIRIAAKLEGADRESVIVLGLERAASLTADELVASATAGAPQTAILVFRYLGKVRDLSASSAVRIAAILQGPAKDRLVREAIGRVPSFTTEGLLALAAAAYSEREAAVLAGLAKISDFTVANAILCVQTLTGANRDEFLLSAVLKVTDLTSDNLITLASNAHEKRDEIIRRGVERLSHP